MVKMISKEFSFELRREFLHAGMGTVIILLALYNLKFTLWYLFSISIVGIILSLLSLRLKIPFIHQALNFFERKEYLKTFPGKGVIFYAAGCLLSLKLFSLDIALASIAILALGDSLPHAIARILRHDEKEVGSMIIGTIIATVAAAFFVPILFAFIGSCFAMAAEFIGLKLGQDNVDDNFYIPLVSGTVIYLLFKFLM